MNKGKKHIFSPQETAMLDQITTEIETVFKKEIMFITKTHDQVLQTVERHDEILQTFEKIDTLLSKEFTDRIENIIQNIHRINVFNLPESLSRLEGYIEELEEKLKLDIQCFESRAKKYHDEILEKIEKLAIPEKISAPEELCGICKNPLFYSDQWDAHYCNSCDIWKESKCCTREGHSACYYECWDRPERPNGQ